MLVKDTRIFISRHREIIGSVIKRKFKSKGFENIVTRTHSELDLRYENFTKQNNVQKTTKTMFKHSVESSVIENSKRIK